MLSMRSPVIRALLLRASFALLALCGATAGEARARIFVGFGIPLFFPPVVVAPPVYYPPYYGPPMVYAPPGDTFSYTPPSAQSRSLAPPRNYGTPGGYSPGGYPPPGSYAPSGGYSPSGGYTPSMGVGPEAARSCQAGAYVCPLVRETPPGGACACPGHNGQRIRGQAD